MEHTFRVEVRLEDAQIRGGARLQGLAAQEMIPRVGSDRVDGLVNVVDDHAFRPELPPGDFGDVRGERGLEDLGLGRAVARICQLELSEGERLVARLQRLLHRFASVGARLDAKPVLRKERPLSVDPFVIEQEEAPPMRLALQGVLVADKLQEDVRGRDDRMGLADGLRLPVVAEEALQGVDVLLHLIARRGLVAAEADVVAALELLGGAPRPRDQGAEVAARRLAAGQGLTEAEGWLGERGALHDANDERGDGLRGPPGGREVLVVPRLQSGQLHAGHADEIIAVGNTPDARDPPPLLDGVGDVGREAVLYPDGCIWPEDVTGNRGRALDQLAGIRPDVQVDALDQLAGIRPDVQVDALDQLAGIRPDVQVDATLVETG